MSKVALLKKAVAASLQTPLRVGDNWEPIAMEWYTKWKAYVDTEPGEQPDEALHPGPVDNSPLQGKYEDDLLPGLVDETHFVLLRTTTAEMLFTTYGGGPRFIRNVINVGTVYSPIYQVALYRVRVEGYKCSSAYPNPDSVSPDRHIVRYFAKTTLYKSVIEGLMDGFSVNSYSNAVRCWIYDAEEIVEKAEDTMADKALNRDSPSQSTSEETQDTISRPEGGDSKRARVGRLLTTDVTDRDGPWKYVRQDYQCRIQELLGTRDTVKIIIEVAESRKPSPQQWPRSAILNKWKKELRAGDIFDGKDKFAGSTWYPAVVKEVTPKGDICVHFKGWATKFDEVISTTRLLDVVEPLYSQSYDRREWEAGDDVDFRVAQGDELKPAVWIMAKICNVDPITERVQVEYCIDEKEKAIARFSDTGAAVDPTAASVVDDDAAKKLAQVRGSPLPSAPPLPSPSCVTTSATAENAEGVASGYQRAWCEVLGDDVCPLHTHTKKPTNKSTAVVEVGRSSHSSSFSSPLSSAFNYISKPFQSNYSEKHVKGTPEVAGAVGLQNLGNTCFMNSILQCTSNTEPISRLFMDDSFKAQLNTNNPLGHGGKLAIAYGKLIKDMWSNAYSKIIPRDFKHTIGEFQPQFAGYDQQDSQEFLGFLMDGLHEDLNRVMKKPHVTKIESKGRPDVMIASESWRRYLLRNDSELVDRCFGQLKSHVTCTNCGNESVTFDEFSSISLPIPVRNTRPVSVVVQLLPHSSLPVQVELEVEITATMNQLQKILINKLTELQLLTIGHTHSSCVSMGQTSHADSADNSQQSSPGQDASTDANMEIDDSSRTCTTNASKTSSPQTGDAGGDVIDSFEMVPRHAPGGIAAASTECEDERASAGGVTVSESDAAYVTVYADERMEGVQRSTSASPSVCQQTKEGLSADTSEGASAQQPAGLFFHFGTLFSSRPSSVFKHYNAAEHGSMAVHSFVGRHDSLMAFQLERWAPEVRSITHYSSYSYSRTPPPQYDPADTDCGFVAIDVCMGKRVTTSYSSYERLEFGGYPYRITLPLNCTNRYVHKKLLELSRRFLKDDSEFYQAGVEQQPYKLAVTGQYSGSPEKRAVPLDEEVFEPPASGSEVLAMIWPNDFDEHLEEDQVAALRALPERVLTPRQQGGPLSIYQCFDKFIEREQLAEAETLYCSKCKQHLAPIKKMDVWAAPDILVVQLKRFQYIPGQYFVHREKINEVVDFPVVGLDLSKYVIGPHHSEAPPVYDLYAVSQHMGGMGGGHYTAVCKNFINNKWYEFNDSSVSETSPERAVNGSAYVLFYKRRSGTLKWAGITPSPVPMPDE